MRANSPRLCFSILTLSLLILIAAATFACAQTPNLDEAMALLQAETAKLGEPRSEGPSLYFGGTKMNENYEIVDKVKERFGITATLFLKEDGCFRRVSTNIIKVAGIRAIGSVLDPNGPAIEALLRGGRFAGQVDVFGQMYDAIYEPILDAGGAVVGAYYVGALVK
ncbi:MAG: Cache 3/Cache 2 fusion domain-containing protein [Syntrophobacter sp.]